MESFTFLVPFDPLHWTLICLQPLYSSHENLIKSSWHGDGRTYPFSSRNLDKLLLSSNLFFFVSLLIFFLNLGLILFAAGFYFTCHRVHSLFTWNARRKFRSHKCPPDFPEFPFLLCFSSDSSWRIFKSGILLIIHDEIVATVLQNLINKFVTNF